MKTLLTRILALTSLAAAACGPVDPCVATGGTGNLTVRLSSPAASSRARGTLTGPDGTTRTFELSGTESTIDLHGIPSGRWTAAADRYSVPGTRVSHAYAAPAAETCFAAGEAGIVTVTWAEIESSGKLWTLNGSGGEGALLGFGESAIDATGTASAVSKGGGPFGRDVAFDRDGNVWAHGATTADAHIVMTEARHLVPGMANKSADRSINLTGMPCLPSMTALAFDRTGNLWVSSACAQKVYRLTPSQIAASGEVTAEVVLSGFDAPTGLAFDAAGNLFVADAGAGRIVRFDAASLSASTSTPSSVVAVLATDNPDDLRALAPSWLAFDAAGTLWADDFGANVIFSVSAAQLAVAGDSTVTPGVRITLAVSALMEGLAFDTAGGLWVAYSTGKLARLDRSQLSTPSSPGAPTTPETVMSSSDIAYASNLAFFPAPAGLPLFHSL